MERFRYRSTSLVDLMAELRQRDLIAEASRVHEQRHAPVRRRAARFGLPILGRRRKG